MTTTPLHPVSEDDSRRALVAMLIATGVFAALSIWSAITSKAFLEADACTHYLYSRFAFAEPHYLVNVWGRPFATLIYAPAASTFGRLGVRITSLLIALAIATITWRIAKDQKMRWPALAFIFVLAQPLVFLHSFSELTELPFALLIALALWAYQHRKWGWMAILIGLTPTARPEGFGFILVAAVALTIHRARWLPLLVVPLIVWNHFGWWLYGQTVPWWKWLISEWPWSQTSLYPPGHLVHFLWFLPAAVGPMVFPAMVVGIWNNLRTRRGDIFNIVVAIIPLLVLIGHSLLYWLGKMASNGEPRYLLTVAPFWALLTARGWEWIFARFNWKHPFIWAGAASIVAIWAQIAYPVIPLRLMDDWTRSQAVAQWYRTSGIAQDYPYLCTGHPAVYYYLDISSSGPKAKEWHHRTFVDPPKGTLLIWDPIYGFYNSDSARSIESEDVVKNGWILLGNAGDWIICVSPSDVRGNPSTPREPINLP